MATAWEKRGIELHQIAWFVAGICSLVACILSFWMIYKHLKYYTEPRIQRLIVRLIIMIPIYAIDSFISLVLREYALYFNVGRDCYEAYVLYIFFRLLIEFANGEENLVNQLEEQRQIRYSIPLCCWYVKPGRIFLHRCKQMILQYVVCKPILAIITFILELTKTYDEGNFSPKHGYLYVSILYNISITISLYFLVLFYEATKDILAPYKPISKFLCIKAVIFFSFWQGIVLAGMAHFQFIVKAKDDWTVEDVAVASQNFLICVETVPIAIAFLLTFGYKSFKNPNASQILLDEELGPRGKVVTALQNFSDVANVRDVLDDTVIAMRKGPARNIVVGDFMDLSAEEKQERVIRSGWIEKRGEDLIKLWKKRYCLLISSPKGIVYFKGNIFEQEQEFRARNFIDFATLMGVMYKQNKFKVVTPGRNWTFRTETDEECETWVKDICSAAKILPLELEIK